MSIDVLTVAGIMKSLSQFIALLGLCLCGCSPTNSGAADILVKKIGEIFNFYKGSTIKYLHSNIRKDFPSAEITKGIGGCI